MRTRHLLRLSVLLILVIGCTELSEGQQCISGDLDCNGVVNIFDLVTVATNFGKASGFDPKADTNKDGVVNIFDLVLVAKNFGKESVQEDWNHEYPRLANQHFGKSPAEWYARHDLIISKTPQEVIEAAKAIDTSTKFLYTDGIIGPPPDKDNNMMKCEGWTDDFFARRANGEVAHAGSPWAPRLADMASLPQTPKNSRGERYNEYGARCQTEYAIDGGYDGSGTDWVWHKPREAERNIDFDRNTRNDYDEHGENWVNSVYAEGVSDFFANWRTEMDKAYADDSVPIWINSGTLHDNARFSNVLENTNGPEYEMKPGFRNFAYDWKQYGKWIKNGRKPTVWVSDIRPNEGDPYTYKRGGHSKNYYELMRMMLAFTLMGDGYFEFQPIEAGEHKFYAYYDEFDVRLGYPTDIGERGPHDDAHTLASGVMVRFFDRGAAIMNPNSARTTVSDSQLSVLSGYAGPYYRFRGGQDTQHNSGARFTTVTLDGHKHNDISIGDGIILVKEEDTIVSDIIIDNLNHYTSPGSEGAQLVGQWKKSEDQGNSWSHRQAAWHDLYSYETSTDSSASITFIPTIGIAGRYEVFEWHPDVANAANSVQYAIKHRDSTATKTVNQQRASGKWNSLGTYNFIKGESGKVTVTRTGSQVLVADAVKFVWRG